MSQGAHGVMALAGRLKAWIVGFVLWAVVLRIFGIGDDDVGPTAALVGCGMLFLYLLIVSMVRISWPVRVRGRDANRLVGGSKTHALYWFRGVTHSVGRNVDSQTAVSGTVSTDGLGNVHGQIGSHTTTKVHDRFSLTDREGRQHTVEVEGAYVPLGEGQLVTAVWAVSPGRKRGPYICVVNHSTGTPTWVSKAVYPIIFGGGVGLAVLWATLAAVLLSLGGRPGVGGLVFVVGMFWFVVVIRLQAAFLRNVGSKPLIRIVTEQAAEELALTRSGASAPPAYGPQPAHPPVHTQPLGAPASGVGAHSAPVSPPPPARWETPTWVADPTGRHEFRYWNGLQWTADVSDAGVVGQDTV
ncbi:MAG: DUF2510 domain-containing protein [Intrasporangium sp.]|uniref:DUF2510 domain-containing protein n=1 Tax=Intrasporangium sp. TaxID=1925024 RepID=UPI0026496709|nr:DUF2510 domain-containing protein [Intrasporangium sp.]MDN5794703.1 DUF2510 domain-containing protein [Intrasporangium sp.]